MHSHLLTNLRRSSKNIFTARNVSNTIITEVNKEPDPYIAGLRNLSQNYPNPFNPNTKIKYTVGDAYYASPVSVTLKVYDVLGNEIAALVDEYKSAGSYEVEFNSSAGGHQLASGVYFYRIAIYPVQPGTQTSTEVKKMLLLK